MMMIRWMRKKFLSEAQKAEQWLGRSNWSAAHFLSTQNGTDGRSEPDLSRDGADIPSI